MPKLKDSYLCMDCDEIFTIDGKPGASCPSCTSRSFAPISGWITSQDLADRLHAAEDTKHRVPAVVKLAVSQGVEAQRLAVPVFEGRAAGRRR
jgi:hypothetical protein